MSKKLLSSPLTCLALLVAFGAVALGGLYWLGLRLDALTGGAEDSPFRFADHEAEARTEAPPRTVVWLLLDGYEREDLLGLGPACIAGSVPDVLEGSGADGSLNVKLATLLTGLAPEQHGVEGLSVPGRARLSAAEHTVAEAEAGRGVVTAAFLALPQLDAELSGLAQGFATWSAPAATVESAQASVLPSSVLLGRLERELGRTLVGDDDVLLVVHLADALAPVTADDALWRSRFIQELRTSLTRLQLDEEVDAALSTLEVDFAGGYESLDGLLGRRRSSPARLALEEALRRAHAAVTVRSIEQLLAWLELAGRAATSDVRLVGIRGAAGRAPSLRLVHDASGWKRAAWGEASGLAELGASLVQPTGGDSSSGDWLVRTGGLDGALDLIATDLSELPPDAQDRRRHRIGPEPATLPLDVRRGLRLEVRPSASSDAGDVPVALGGAPPGEVPVPRVATRQGESFEVEPGAPEPVVDVTLDRRDHLIRLRSSPGEAVRLVLAVQPLRALDEPLVVTVLEGEAEDRFVGRPDHRVLEGKTPLLLRVSLVGSERLVLAASVAGRPVEADEMRYRGKTWARPGESVLWLAPWLPSIGAALDTSPAGETPLDRGVLRLELPNFRWRADASLTELEHFRFVRRLGSRE